MTQTRTNQMVWTCPGCGTEVPVPTPPRGVIECPPWNGDSMWPPEGEPCGQYAYSLDHGGLADLINTQQVDPSPVVRLLGDCGGCTPEESREFEARFPLLDEIDREFRTRGEN